MTSKLYTVTLADLATYSVTVAADYQDAACKVAKTALLDEATTLAPGFSISKREVDASAEPAPVPIRLYRVHGVYSVDFAITVPANNNEAERHARRLYAEEPFPWEHESGDERVQWRFAEEVVS